MSTTISEVSRVCCRGLLAFLAIIGLSQPSRAQTRLRLQDAVNQALESRASLKAEAERVAGAQGVRKQAGLWANPTFQFQNENLRPGQIYTQDVDTVAYLTQPLDILGKRGQRIAVEDNGIHRSEAEYGFTRRQIAQIVRLSYWAARGAQEIRDSLKATVENFQRTVDYQSAQLSVGAISEQDFLRVQLEGERLNIAANLAVIEAARARVQLLREMGQTTFGEVVLTEPLDADASVIPTVELSQVLADRAEMKVALATLLEAKAKAKLQDVAARPI